MENTDGTPLKTCHLFAGAGGGLLADLILGHKPVAAIEWDAYCCQVLRERVADGWFPEMRVHEGDVRLFDSSEYKGRVDCIHAGFPCQDISVAGNQAGVGEGTRSGLYREVLRIADEIRPEHIFLENVAAIVNGDDGRMLRTVVGDLAERGFDAVWNCLSASEIGAAHKRNRWWLLAFPSKQRCDSGSGDRKKRHVQNNQKRKSAEIQRKGYKWKFRACKACDVLSTTELTKKLANANGERCVHGKLKIKPAENRKYAQRDSAASSEDVSNALCKRHQRQGKRIDTCNPSENSERKAGYAINDGEQGKRKTQPDMGRVVDDISDRIYKNGELYECKRKRMLRVQRNIQVRKKKRKNMQQGLRNHTFQKEQKIIGGRKSINGSENKRESITFPDANDWIQEEAQVGRTTKQTENRASRLKALGNGQVPLQAAAAFSILWKMMLIARKVDE